MQIRILLVEKYLHTEKELLQNLSESNTFAFEVLFFKYRNKVKGFTISIIPSYIDPEEIVQEVFVKVWLNRKSINPEKDFKAFLFSITKNLVLDYIKSAVNRRLKFVEEYIQQDMMNVEDNNEKLLENAEEKLHNLIQQIPERRKEIFCLSRFEGLTYRQIAERLNISENTVDSQIRNATAFLKKEFKKLIILGFLLFYK